MNFENSPEAAMQFAVKLLAARAHGSKELADKLYKKGFSSVNVRHAIEESTRLGYLDDASFASMYVNELKMRGKGRLFIRNALSKKRLDKETVGEAMENCASDPEEELATAIETLRSKVRSLARESDRQKRRAKAFRFLASRGFAPDIIWKAFASYPELA